MKLRWPPSRKGFSGRSPRATRLTSRHGAIQSRRPIVPTKDGVYVRSFKGKKGRWYQEALANPIVAIRVGGRKVPSRVEPEKNPAVNREVSAAYQEKYGRRWPDETKPMLAPSVVSTTLRVQEISSANKPVSKRK